MFQPFHDDAARQPGMMLDPSVKTWYRVVESPVVGDVARAGR